MAALAIHLFGQPRFALGGLPYKFSGPPKTLPLLAYLLLHRSGPVSREKVAFTLWEDETEEDARANLRRHLHHLQRALPPAAAGRPWILVDVDTLQWNPDADAWLDVAEFERRASSESERAGAVDLYAGDLLESLYEEWLFGERDRLASMYQSLLGALLLESRSTRDLARAAICAQKILANDPWREDAVRQLMAIRYDSGDRAGALAVYQQFDQRLRAEMDVDPMPETTALRDAILRNEQLPAASAVAAQRESPVTPVMPFVGRDLEMEQLRSLWSRAARGRGSVALVGGEAGIGKSRLAFEFAMVAEAQGARVMTGATSYPESAPYQAVAEAFRSVAPLMASLPVQPVWLGVVAQAVPELRSRLPDLPLPPPADPDRERLRLFEAFSTCIEALAQPRPVVLILEDMHWAGEASIAALQFLGRRVARLPVLIVATHRDEETPRSHPLRRARRALQEERILSIVAPRRLQREAVSEVMRRMPALSGRSVDLADVLTEQSAGNPLFLNEVIRNLLENPDAPQVAPPANARRAIEMRIVRLADAPRALADVAAVVGQGFNVELVRDVMGWTESDVVDALSDLIDRNIVKEAGGRSGYAYAFSHHVIQSTIYANVSPEDRIRRHRRVARVLADSYDDEPSRFAADIARHHDLGGEPEHAARAWFEAGRYASSLYAWDEALRNVRRCIELTHDRPLRVEALLLSESIRARRGDREGQRADLDELERLVDARTQTQAGFAVLRRQALLARAVGERDREGSLVAELVSRAALLGDARSEAEAQVATAGYATLTGDSEGGRVAAEAALQSYQQLGDLAGQIEARCRLVELAYQGGAFDLAVPLLAEARAAAAATGNPLLLARAITAATHAAISEQHYAACREMAAEAREAYAAIGDREGEADAIVRQAAAAARLSLLDEARRCYDEALAIYRAIGKRLGVAAVLANGGIHSVRLGLVDKAEESLAEALVEFEALKDVRGQTACEVNLSYIALLRDDAASAKAHAQRALELARSIKHTGYEAASFANLGAAERELGELESAVAHMQEGVSVRRRLNQPAEYADELAHLALLHAERDEAAAARAIVEKLTEALREPSSMLFTPQAAYWAVAQTWRALGDRRIAQEMLERAHTITLEQTSAISNPQEREAYARLRVNREIDAAYRAKQWPALAVNSRGRGKGERTAASAKRRENVRAAKGATAED